MVRIIKWAGFIILGLVAIVCLLALWLVGPGNIGRMAFGWGITYDAEAPKLPKFSQPAILIFSKTNGFRDSAQIAAANAAVEQIAREKGLASFTTQNAAVFNDSQLAQFSAVVWNSVSGDVLTREQRSAFQKWLAAGHGFVGLHGSGGDPSYKWRWYVDELIGAQFIGHTLSPQIQPARLNVENRTHPATRHLDAQWQREDEWYSFASSPRAKGYTVLVSIDEVSYSPRERIPLMLDRDLSMGGDHPMVWTHCVGQGRAFYSALGHRAKDYSEPRHVAMIAGAIAWAAGMEGTGCEKAAAQ